MTQPQEQGASAARIDHEFKSHPDVFWPAARGEKTFEYRRDDRGGYEVGQTVRLRCYALGTGYVDTPPLDRRITNILRGGEFELPLGFCILSLAPLADGAGTMTAGGEPPILRAVVEVYPDRTDTRLTFGERIRPDLGVKAVEQAIAALTAEYEARGGCPVVGRQPAGQSAGSGAEIEATQITLGEGLVDITRIDHEGRMGVLFRPRTKHIAFGEPGELPEGTYWPVKGDVVLWVSGEGPGVAIKALADLAPDSTRTGQVETGELRGLISEAADAVFAIGRATLSEQQVDRAYTAAERLLDYRDRNLSATHPVAPEAWKRTGNSILNPMGGGTEEWFCEKESLVKSFPHGFNPNTGLYDFVIAVDPKTK